MAMAHYPLISLLSFCLVVTTSLVASDRQETSEFQVLFQEAQNCQKIGYIQKAGNLFYEAGSKGHQRSIDALGSMGMSIIDKNKKLAQEILKKAVSLGCVPAEIALGQSYAQERNHEMGIGIFKKLAETYPADSNMQNNLGLMYETIGQLNLAKEKYETAVKLGNSKALLGLGTVSARQKNKKAAISYFKQAGDKGIFIGYFNIGIIYFQSGNKKTAHTWFKEAADADLRLSDAQWNIGAHLFKQGKLQDALPYLIIAADQGEPGVWPFLGCYASMAPNNPKLAKKIINCAEKAFDSGVTDAGKALIEIYQALEDHENTQKWQEYTLLARYYDQEIEDQQHILH